MIKKIVFSLLVFLTLSATTNARTAVNGNMGTMEVAKKKKKEPKVKVGKKIEAEENLKNPDSKVYVFGVSEDLTDSVVYITAVNEIDSLALTKKTKFIPYRAELSLQLKEYLEGTKQLQRQTTAVFYSLKKNKIAKRQYKVKKKFLDKLGKTIIYLTNEEFVFKNPLNAFGQE